MSSALPIVYALRGKIGKEEKEEKEKGEIHYTRKV
jgi:hypothetical protein